MTSMPSRLRLAAIATSLLAVSCVGVTGPTLGDAVVLVVGNSASSITVVDGGGDSVLGRVGPIASYKGPGWISADSSVFFLVAAGDSGKLTLYEVALSTLSVIRAVRTSEISARSTVGSLTVYGDYLVVPTPDGTGLLMNAARGGVPGIAYVDAASLTPRLFFDSLLTAPYGAAMMASTGTPGGVEVLVLTRRLSPAPAADWLRVFSASGQEIRDSLEVAPAAIGGGYPTSTEVLAAGRTATVYVVRPGLVTRFNLDTKQEMDSVLTGSGRGWLCRDARTGRLYLTNPGDGFDSPGTGMLTVYDSTLAPLPSVDLRGESVGGMAPVLRSCEVNDRLHVLYVSSGTGSAGPLFGVQPGRLLSVGIGDSAFVRAVPLDDWGVGQIVVP